METQSEFLTPGQLALWGGGYGGSRCHEKQYKNGTTATAVALGSAGLAVAIFGTLAIGWGINQASKARSIGNQNAIAQQTKTMELLAATVNREAVRSDGITVDVNQTMRSLAAQTATANALAQGGSSTSAANALATAEALALLQNNANNASNPLSSVIDNCCSLRVQRVSTRNCGCDSCGG